MYTNRLLRVGPAGLVPTLLLLACACGKPSPDPQAAVVTALVGRVNVEYRDGRRVGLTSGNLYTKDALLGPGALISTGPKSSADIAFTSGIRMRLGENGSMRINTALVVSEKKFSRVRVALLKGRLFAASDRLGPTSRFSVGTPGAFAFVRGTEFLVKTDGTKTETLVKQGAVEAADQGLTNLEPVEAGKKAETVGTETVVKEQTPEDKQELNSFTEVATISEQGRSQITSILQTFEEQKQLIKVAMEEQKRSNEELIGSQKDKDRELVGKQRDRDLETLRSQIARDQELIRGARGAADQRRDEVTSKGREDLDRIKRGTESKELDKTKSDLERLKRLQ